MGCLPASGGVGWLVFIGIVWGATNPLIKRGARISEERQARRRQKQLQRTTGSSSSTTGSRWQEEKKEDDEQEESVEKRRREEGEESKREGKEKKKHTEDKTEEGKKGVVSTFVGFWANLLCQWEYLVPFALNLSGSVFFFAALGNHVCVLYGVHQRCY
ncbi:hypothetical protein CBR_g4775 [Chara braunii]|uniref:Transmembrane protein n=1 Tax=Chara braunii TaxID=69332 RepID=A0A388KIV8_CHABU|nr:hypothetical protein CBR_g4775 [Chara braunii]|eukprot:GBG69948.1 hypothetical protein CBR_g4775 [Chara braunii]